MRKILFLIIFLLTTSIHLTYAATISGNVYDISLNKVNANVEINTKPMQRDITENGFYNFNVKPGNYTITAGILEEGELKAYANEAVNIIEDGDYVFDLILFPDLSEDETIADEQIDINPSIIDDEKQDYTLILIIVLIVIIILFFIFLKKKKKFSDNDTDASDKKEDKQDTKTDNTESKFEDDLPQKVIDFIKKEGGRTTQKDIRKQFPSSEAKISLVITQLEHENKIKKIKKGRGKIIILV